MLSIPTHLIASIKRRLSRSRSRRKLHISGMRKAGSIVRMTDRVYSVWPDGSFRHARWPPAH